MKALTIPMALSLLAAGCTSSWKARYPYPVLAEFTVAGISADPVLTRETAEKVALGYFHEFDDSGSIQFKAEQSDRWVFSAQAGDFVASPVGDLVVRKDGTVISQGGVGPIVKLTDGRWIYDKRLERLLQWDLDLKELNEGRPNKSPEAAPGSRPPLPPSPSSGAPQL